MNTFIYKVLLNFNIYDKLINRYNILNSSNILRWFKKNVPIKFNKNNWINIKKSFIYGFNMNCIAYLHDKMYNNLYYNNKYLNNSANNYSLIVYINNDMFDNSINITIYTDIDTIIELNLNYYNPTSIKFINISNKLNNSIIKFINDYYFSINKKNHIGHLVYKKRTSDNLLDKNNNIIPNLIKLWTNIKYSNNIFQPINTYQLGGNYLEKLTLFQLINLYS